MGKEIFLLVFFLNSKSHPKVSQLISGFPHHLLSPSVLIKYHLWGYHGLLTAASQLEHSDRGFLALNPIIPLILHLPELILLSPHPPQ